MKGEEARLALLNLQRARSDRQMELMKDYDQEYYRPAILNIMKECEHESEGIWRRNGIGWSWTECRWCGHRLEEGPTEEHGGVLGLF